jgi:hypothetical protein
MNSTYQCIVWLELRAGIRARTISSSIEENFVADRKATRAVLAPPITDHPDQQTGT